MDILSFVLGIGVVVIIALSVIAVISFVKVRKIERQIGDIESSIYREIESEITETHRRIDDLEKDIFSQLDSRLDKLENKIITKK